VRFQFSSGPDGSPNARDSSAADSADVPADGGGPAGDVLDGSVDGFGTQTLDADREAGTDASAGTDGRGTGSRWLSLQAPIGASIGALALGPEGNLYAGGRSPSSIQPGSGSSRASSPTSWAGCWLRLPVGLP
jgi:hypothetical protein